MVQGTVWISDSIYVGAGTGGGTSGTISVKDEGGSIHTNVDTLNFVGSDVMAKVSSIGGQVNVYVPTPTYSSHFNTSDGVNDAGVDSIPTVNRKVASPASEGTPYSVGDFNLGLNHACVSATSISYETNSSFSIADLGTSITCTVYNADGVSILAQNSINLTGNGNSTSSGITITISNFNADNDKYSASAVIDISLASILPDGGRFSIKIDHTNGIEGTFSKTQNDIFYDSESATAGLTGVSISSLLISSSKYLSGVRYFDIGDSFTIGIADIDGINADSYPTNFIHVDGSIYGIPDFYLSGPELTDWNTAYNLNDASYSGIKTITAPDYRYIGTEAHITANVIDWIAGSNIVSPDAGVLIDTYTTESNELAEFFTDETYRLTSAGATWDSTQDMSAYDDSNGLLVQGGLLQVRSVDYTGYAPTGSPDYSGFSGTGTYYRSFTDVYAQVRNSVELNITGFTLQDLIDEKVKIWIDIPGRFTSPCYLHGVSEFDYGTFDGDNDPIRTNDSTTNTIKASFGTLGLTSSQDYFVMHIEIIDPTVKPSSIVVSW